MFQVFRLRKIEQLYQVLTYSTLMRSLWVSASSSPICSCEGILHRESQVWSVMWSKDLPVGRKGSNCCILCYCCVHLTTSAPESLCVGVTCNVTQDWCPTSRLGEVAGSSDALLNHLNLLWYGVCPAQRYITRTGIWQECLLSLI